MAGANITIEVDDRALRAGIRELAARIADPAAALRDIGEHLLRTTDERYRREQAPDGSPWAPLAETTLARRVNAKGQLRSKGKILRDSGVLQDTIRYQLAEDGRAVAVGTDRVYGAAQQFGMPQGYAGKTKRGGPIPWGDIPARPFLGLEEADGEAILAILGRHLAKS
jgi:phage virion morphogenesis protein